ncbi:MAG: aldehyde dehydrogenase family protein [Gammaproteobacteria bacterium]|nr:MAG: aldehyde dehydrogenase family protein [Gammaproteobacteria bacterium]
MFIDGALCWAASGRTYPNINPATEAEIGQVADAGPEDMERAIAAARRAFDGTDWSTNHAFRVKCLRQLEAGLKAVREELRDQVIAEVGAPRGIVEGPQCDGPLEMIDWTINYLENFQWERESGQYEVMGAKSRHLVWKEAAGVVAAITPWNFPVQINLAKIIPALAAGCTVVLKPAPDTPWCATIIGRVVAEHTDIPAGVFNVVTASNPAEVGEMLCTDPRVDVISFTGSTNVGRHIMALASATVKKVFLELGGKSANIVLDDADLGSSLLSNLAVCFHAGQGCAIATRLLLPKACYEEGVELVKQYFGFISQGNPQAKDQIMGPLINKKQQERVLAYIEKGKAEGARLVVGGGVPAGLEKGFYVEPTLFADVTNDMTIAREEIFGPVLVVIPYEDEEDAIRIANDSIFGLSAMVWSASDERALRVAHRLRTGTVNVNGGNFLGPDAPFGGYKQSGVGREMGVEGFEEYLETKTVAVKA